MRVPSIILTTLLGAVIACLATVTLFALSPDALAASSGTIQFEHADYVVNESAGSVTVALHRVGGDAGLLTATLQTFDGTAIHGDDYSGIATQSRSPGPTATPTPKPSPSPSTQTPSTKPTKPSP